MLWFLAFTSRILSPEHSPIGRTQTPHPTPAPPPQGALVTRFQRQFHRAGLELRGACLLFWGLPFRHMVAGSPGKVAVVTLRFVFLLLGMNHPLPQRQG